MYPRINFKRPINSPYRLKKCILVAGGRGVLCLCLCVLYLFNS